MLGLWGPSVLVLEGIPLEFYSSFFIAGNRPMKKRIVGIGGFEIELMWVGFPFKGQTKETRRGVTQLEGVVVPCCPEEEQKILTPIVDHWGFAITFF